jgi:hypothetical protein
MAVAYFALAGCATQPAEEPRVEPAPVVMDNFCTTARKRTWSVKDTPATITEADAWNRAVDRRCGAR